MIRKFKVFPLLFLLTLLMIPAYAQTLPAELHIMGERNFDVMDTYQQETGTSIVFHAPDNSMMDEIANGFVTRDTQVDIYLFDAHQGLYYLKEKGYYEPLNHSKTLMTAYGDLYPEFQKALMHKGELAAWVMYAQPFVRSELTDVLQANGVQSPATFDDLLNACETLLASDVIGSEYSLMDVVAYDRQDMLDFFMKQYILSSQTQYGAVDFAAPEFAATVKRIKTELSAQPPTNPFEEEGSIPSPIFSLMTAYEMITTDMLPMPTVLRGVPTAIETYMTVAVVNPSSPRKDLAVQFLEYCAQARNPSVYFYNAAYLTPTENPEIVAQIEADNAQLAALQNATVLLTPQQKAEVTRLQQVLEDLQKQRYWVSPEAIRHYAAMAQHLSIAEASPVTYDEALQGLADRYLRGSLDLTGFVAACQKHAALIGME